MRLKSRTILIFLGFSTIKCIYINTILASLSNSKWHGQSHLEFGDEIPMKVQWMGFGEHISLFVFK